MRELATLRRGSGGSRAAAPVRIVHLGLGAFFRAHGAWYTDRAVDAEGWGIAAFGGRSGALAATLASQDHLYTLVARGPTSDTCHVVASLTDTRAAADHDAWSGALASRSVAVVTITVTEAGYHRGPSGALDVDDPLVRGDLDELRRDPTAAVATAPARLVSGLAARRAADAGPLTIVSCDNLAGNGTAARAVVLDLAAAIDPNLAVWIDETATFASTMVDRITPAATDADVARLAAETGRHDAAPVVTEPYSEWVLAGSFAAGRPAWETAGARFVDDVVPFEDRKLRLLNGAHSLLAYLGSARGHHTVAAAIDDATCLAIVQRWWRDARTGLSFSDVELDAYEQDLLDRFANSRIEHHLAQIAVDGSQKLPVRVAPTLRERRATGAMPEGAVWGVASWVCHLRGAGAPVVDVGATHVVALASGPPRGASRRVLGFLGSDLGDDDELVGAVAAAVGEIEGMVSR